MAGSAGSQTSAAERAQAIGSLIWNNPDRLLNMLPDLRRAGVVMECRLRGASMGRAIPAGSRIRIDLGSGSSPQPGEIVAFLRSRDICVHRVAYRGRRGAAHGFLVTQGDACFYPDAPVAISRVIGRVTEYQDGAAWCGVGEQGAGEHARSWLGRVLVCVVALLTEINIPLARGFARMLRLVPERGGAVAVTAPD